MLCVGMSGIFLPISGKKFQRITLKHVGNSISFILFKSVAWQFNLMLFEKNKNIVGNTE